MTASPATVVLAAGGTGGHVFPARALCGELKSRGFNVILMTDNRGQGYEAMFPGIEILSVPSGTPSARGLSGKIKAIFAILSGTMKALVYLGRYKPAAVIGFGGYPSLPAVLAAALKRLPIILHEQNAVLGRVNRLLARFAKRIATSFVRTEGIADSARGLVVGNPVRSEIRALTDTDYIKPEDNGSIEILILGGSQGAAVLSEILPGAISALPESLRRRLRVTQQCRPEDLAQVENQYKKAGITSELASFFNNVPELLSKCHLAITRSGASTIAELAVAGRPALFIPFKFAMDDHQRKNADQVVASGGATMILQDEFTIETARDSLENLLEDPAHLSEMAYAIRSVARPDAAEKLASFIEELLLPATNAARTKAGS